MSEIHTIEFLRGSFNLISDAERGRITLQYAGEGDEFEPVGRVLGAIRRRYGAGVLSRLDRWRAGEDSPFVLPPHSKPHPENPDVLCFEIGIKPGERLETALATLLDFLRRQPDYRRTYGSSLDPDEEPSRVQDAPSADSSNAAGKMLRKMLDRRKFKRPGDETPKGRP